MEVVLLMNTKRQQVIEKLIEKIYNREIVNGDKLLPERQLVVAVGETRSVLREGLIALEAMGVLDIRDRQGIYLSSREENAAKMLLAKVNDWPADVLSRGMEIRQILDPPAAALAAIRHSLEDIEKLNNCLEHMKIYVGESGLDAAKAGSYWNAVYHGIIVSASGNQYMARIYEGLFSMLEHGLSLMRIGTSPREHGGRELDFQEHTKLVNIIAARNSVEAELFAEEHLRHTVIAMVKLGQIVPSSDLYNQRLTGCERFKEISQESDFFAIQKCNLIPPCQK